MSSFNFPKIFNKNSTQVLEGPTATKNDLYLILSCEKGEQLGDPDFGVNLHKAKFKVNTSLAKELAIDGIVESQKFINNILFYGNDVKVIKVGPAKLDIEIQVIFSQATNVKELVVLQGVEIE